MSIKTKILIPAIALTLLVAAAILASNIALFSDFVDSSASSRVNSAQKIAVYHMESLHTKASSVALSMAENNQFNDTIARGNREELLALSTDFRERTEVEFCTIMDARGNVLARSHEPLIFGDSLTRLDTVKSAMAGQEMTALEVGSIILMSVRTAMPVFDSAGNVSGIVSAGYRLDRESFVDEIKEISGCEVTVILDGVRIATTVTHGNGARAVGTQPPAEIVEMLAAGFPYTGQVEILGRSSIASYGIIEDAKGRAVGSLYTGLYLEETAGTIYGFVRVGLVITVGMLAAFIAVILFIVGRIISPIYIMTRAAAALAEGDTDIDIGIHADKIRSGESCTLADAAESQSANDDFSDEIDMLAAAFSRMIENTKRQLYTIEQIAAGSESVSVEARSEKDLVNSALTKLNATIRAQAAAIREENDRVRIMLDASPLAIRLWDRNLNLRACNEAAVKLFNLKDKQEYLDKYFDLSPEYQPNGQKTTERIKQSVTEAFENGSSFYEWMYRLPDGTPLPAENTLVRVPYDDDYVVAAYSRDLRAQNKMLADIARRDDLLAASNRTASLLFDTADDENIEDALLQSMELLGQCVKADRVHILQNEMIDNARHFTFKYVWDDNPADAGPSPVLGKKYPYAVVPGWEKKFLRGEYVNGSVKDFPDNLKVFYDSLTVIIKSSLVIPVFVQEEFWGLVSFHDSKADRSFGEDEVSILRSASLMMAAAVSRSVQSARIREAHNRARLLTNATPLGFNLWDSNFNNIETNDTAVNLFGAGSQEEYLENFFKCSPEYQADGTLSREIIMGYVSRAFNEGYCRVEWPHCKLDGTPVPSEVTLVRLPYEDDFFVAGYIRDLREQKKMLAEIETRDKLLQTVNQAAEMLLRCEPDEFSGTLQQCMGMMARAINAERMYLHKNYIENGILNNTKLHEWPVPPVESEGEKTAQNVSCEGDMPLVKQKLSRGETVHSLVRDLPEVCQNCINVKNALAIMIVPVFIQNEFWGFIGFDNCHSEQLFNENEESIVRSGSMLLANALLRNENLRNIHDTSAKLEIALADAKEANNTKSSFLAHMSHEIRTPLNAVIGFSELTLDEENITPESKSNLENIYSAGSTILSIVNDILDVSKIESGKFALNPVQYDTPSLINDTVILNIGRIGEKNISFKLHVDENLPGTLFGDDLRVKQIFNNLLSNAFKYTDEGTVEWRVTFERDGGSIWLISSVSDTGVGIKQEDVEKLFTDYNQLDARVNRTIEGTGLGLPITKRLVEMMGGTVGVESEYGKGATFTVRMRQALGSDTPIGAEVAENLMTMHYTLSRRAGNIQRRVDLSYAHVLLVDDVQTNLDVAKGMLSPYKMKIDCASSGIQSIEMIRAGIPRYDAVFMDHMMPGMDGIEATRHIREIGTDYARDIPVIALTANAIVGNEEMFLRSGFQDFVSKPIDMMKLDAVIRTWVRDKSRETEIAHNASGESPGNANRAADNAMLDKIKIDGVDMEKVKKYFSGSAAVFTEVLRSYAENTALLLDSLETHLAARNLADYAVAIHGIKGSSYSICAEETGAAAEELELAAKAENFDDVKARHPRFADLARTLLGGINKTLAEIDAAVSKPAAASPDPAVLAELRAACENFDMDRVDNAMAKIESFRYENESGGRLIEWLRARINAAAFEEIAHGSWPDELLST